MAPGAQLNVFKTAGIRNWNLVASKATINDINIINAAESPNRYVNFEPGVPYLYLPTLDYNNVVTQLKSIFSD